jgi:hypothetical protein
MGASRRGIVATTVCLAAVLMINVGAAQALKEAKPRPGFLAQATNGYRIYVSGDSPRRVSVLVYRIDGPGTWESAYYSALGKVTRTKVRASFGALGGISMRFKQTGGIRRGKYDCEYRRRYAAVRGRFRGSFNFVGEGGYAATSVSRATSAPTPVPPQPCSVFGKTHWATVLDADTAGSGTHFSAYKPRRGSSTLLVGVLRRGAGGIKIIRYIQALTPASVFTLSQGFSNADISSPPFPFSGSAQLRNYVSPPAPSKGKWTGSLAGTFAGQGDIPLAGADFNVGVSNISPIY